MEEPPKKPLPEKIKKSIYVHPFINDTDDVPDALIEKLPENYCFLRHSPTHSHLTLVTKQKKEENAPDIKKRTIPVLSETMTNILFTAIFLDKTTVFPNLTQFSKNRNLVLNLVQDISLEDKKTQRNSEEIKEKINQADLLNNCDFYDKYINKQDKIQFPALSKIKPVKDNIYLLTFADNTLALISRNQLLAVVNYTPAPQKNLVPVNSIISNATKQLPTIENFNPDLQGQRTKPEEGEKVPISSSINQILLRPPNNKRKFEENDLNKTSKNKKVKVEEKNTIENNVRIEEKTLENSNLFKV